MFRSRGRRTRPSDALGPIAIPTRQAGPDRPPKRTDGRKPELRQQIRHRRKLQM